ncbi:MAG: hypothetical protein IPH75_16205 [bacterium]|nr:hypothetical protein [bacterium]
MSAFAELIAGFIGLVHELMPQRLRKVRTRRFQSNGHLAPFLHVSGIMYATAEGVCESVNRRCYDVDFYCFDKPLA